MEGQHAANDEIVVDDFEDVEDRIADVQTAHPHMFVQGVRLG